MKIEQLANLKPLLPEIPGIHGKEEYFNSVVLVLLIPVEGEYHFVFQKRSSSIRQGGEICFPGGKFDSRTDLTLEKTALRETSEELGIAESNLQIIGRLDTIIAPMGATVDAFVGLADIRLDEIKANPAEVEDIFSMPVAYFEKYEPKKYEVMIKIHPSYVDKESHQEVILFPAEELNLPERYRTPWGGFRYGVLVYKTNQGVIWGITSRLIYDVVSKLKKL